MLIAQRKAILNLYNSGINPEIIALELDLSQDTVMHVIRRETNEQQRNEISAKRASGTPLLNKSYLAVVLNLDSAIKNAQIRLWKALRVKPEFNISLEQTQDILERYAESKVNLVTLYVDLADSTKLSMTFPVDRLATIIRAFTQEMFLMISAYGGYVLKYVGDAVLAFFVGDLNSTNKDDTNNNNDFCFIPCTNAISCAGSMIRVIREGINPILEQYDYPELNVRVGIDFGENAVVQYGWDMHTLDDGKTILKKPHLDILGYTTSIAVKMTSIAQLNQIVIGESLYNVLEEKQRSTFRRLTVNPSTWNYINDTTGSIYSVYSSINEEEQ